MVDTVSVPAQPEGNNADADNAALKAAAEAGVTVNGEAVEAPAETPAVSPRPDNVPEKFWDAEKGEVKVDAILKSNQELQSQFTKSKQGEEEQPKGEEAKPKGDESNPVLSAREYFDEHGELSDQHYAELEKAGLSREYVDSYIEGQKAVANQVMSHAFSLAGGEEGFTAMQNWAAQNLSQEELAAHNAMVVNDETSDYAISRLYERYLAEAPRETPLISGETGTAGSSDFFRSSVEMQNAMADPRYSRDEAFRKDVERKIANADKAGVNLFT